VGRLLYETFTDTCKGSGCLRMKAITTLGNEGSQRFHLAMGWDAREIDDYAGPSRRRIVFTRDLGVGVGPVTGGSMGSGGGRAGGVGGGGGQAS
jgi:hypothetical protein